MHEELPRFMQEKPEDRGWDQTVPGKLRQIL
jgi:hypothetical protein